MCVCVCLLVEGTSAHISLAIGFLSTSSLFEPSVFISLIVVEVTMLALDLSEISSAIGFLLVF